MRAFAKLAKLELGTGNHGIPTTTSKRDLNVPELVQTAVLVAVRIIKRRSKMTDITEVVSTDKACKRIRRIVF